MQTGGRSQQNRAGREYGSVAASFNKQAKKVRETLGSPVGPRS